MQIAGILTGDAALVGKSLDSDIIIEPVRGPLIPGFAAVKAAAKAAGTLLLLRINTSSSLVGLNVPSLCALLHVLAALQVTYGLAQHRKASEGFMLAPDNLSFALSRYSLSIAVQCRAKCVERIIVRYLLFAACYNTSLDVA